MPISLTQATHAALRLKIDSNVKTQRDVNDHVHVHEAVARTQLVGMRADMMSRRISMMQSHLNTAPPW